MRVFEDRRGEGFHVNSSWHGLVDPESRGCLCKQALLLCSKGNGVNILQPGCG